jgi:hypothetical protein
MKLFRPPLSRAAVLARNAQVLATLPKPLSPAQNAARRMGLAQFVRESWHVIEPSSKLWWGWALDAICQQVQGDLRIDRLICRWRIRTWLNLAI